MTRKSEDLMHYLQSLQVLQVHLNKKKGYPFWCSLDVCEWQMV